MKRALSILLAAVLVLCALPAVAEEGQLKAGRYECEAENGFMYLDDKGVGILLLYAEDNPRPYGVTWTADTLTIERTEIPFAVTDDVLSFTYDGQALALRYEGPSASCPLGDQGGTEFAGNYVAADGKKLSLTADGQGVYTDEAGETPVFWGSFRFYFAGAENQTDGTGYLFFDSFLTNLDFIDGAAVLRMETGEEIPFRPEAVTTVVSAAHGLSLTLPEGGWTVAETDGGVRVYRRNNMIQYTFLSIPLEKEPTAATLDAYADHIWADCLMNVSVAYDAGDVVRGNCDVNGAAGRTLTTEWSRDTGALLKGHSALWYTNSRLYVALCVFDQAAQDEAMALLDGMLQSFRPVEEETADLDNPLPVDREVFEGIRNLAPAPAATEQVFYGYEMSSHGVTIDVLSYLLEQNMDPKSIHLILRSDGTGHLQMMDEDSGGEITWTAESIISGEDSIPYTWKGDHLIFSIGDESIEFAPAAEIEAMLAAMETPQGEPPADIPDTPATPEPSDQPQPSEAPQTSGSEGTAALSASDLIGSWTLTKTRFMGTEIPTDEKSVTLSLVFNEGGVAVELVDGSPTELEWTIREDGKVSVTEAGVEKYVLTFENGALIAGTVAEGLEMIFERDA